MQHGAKVLDTHHRRLPLVQGGLEIPIELIVKMEYRTKMPCLSTNLSSSSTTKSGKFEDVTDMVLKDLEYDATMRQMTGGIVTMTREKQTRHLQKVLIHCSHVASYRRGGVGQLIIFITMCSPY